MYDAFVLEENGLPYRLGSWFLLRDAEQALADLKKIAKPCADQIWYYTKEHEEQ